MWGELFSPENFDQSHAWLDLIWDECVRVLRPGCKLIINIANIARNPYLANHARLYQWAWNRVEFVEPKGDIIWIKTQAQSNDTAWGCYDSKTRVLTDSGFKHFSELVQSDLICTLNTESGTIEYQKPSDYIYQRYVGDMFRIQTKSFDLLVTPNHNILYVDKDGKLQKEQIKHLYETKAYLDIPKNRYSFDGKQEEFFYVPTCEYGKRSKKNYVSNESIRVDMCDWLAFLGIYLTDGSVYASENNYTTSIYQSKDKYFAEIEALLERLPFQFKFKESKDEFYCCNKQLAVYLNQFGKKIERVMPEFVFGLSADQKRHFLHWIMIGDGTRVGNEQRIAVCSNQFSNALSRLLVDCGIHYSRSTRHADGKEHDWNGRVFKNKRDMTVFVFSTAKNYYIENKSISVEKYDGDIYCVTVPNGNMMVERNGKITWCGNSWRNPGDMHLTDNHEYISVFRKIGKRHCPTTEPIIDRDNFLQWRKSDWRIEPESAKRVGHVAPFPLEIPKRLITLYSFEGEIVLDPFVGSGTTLVAAAMLNRKGIGIDKEPKYIELARDRINKAQAEQGKEPRRFADNVSMNPLFA